MARLALVASLASLLAVSVPVAARDGDTPEPSKREASPPPAKDGPPEPLKVIADAKTTTEATVTINGVVIPYRVTVGTQPVWSAENKPIASVFYTFYERTDVTDMATRPLVFSFNGGPGSASVWMHMAYTGPRLLKIDSEGFPVQPYGIQENPHSILDVADIVYVDPVNTGFSRILDESKGTPFFSIREDIEYLAKWISAFVTRHGRWLSPKFLIGESYGTTRVAGLAARLQSSHWMYLNGVILVSPTEMGVKRDGVVENALALPYYAATAWYHKSLAPELQARDLEELLPEVERFTVEELLPAMARGGSLDPKVRDSLVATYARYSGLTPEVVREYAFAVPPSFFWKELLRQEGLTIGRLDSRYRGVDRQDSGTRPEFDPSLASWNHAFAPAINHYLRDVLGYETDLEYWIFGPVSWGLDTDTTAEALRGAMGTNPYLRVLVQSGYYDGATDYFNAKYTMWNMDPAGRFQDRMSWKGYRSGHMMYLRQEDLKKSNDDIRAFIAESLPKPGEPAKH